MIAGVEEQGEHGQEGRHQAALLYAHNGMVASSDPIWLLGVFNALVGIFDRVGLQNDFEKTVNMVFRPFQMAGNQSEELYGRRITVWDPPTGSARRYRFTASIVGRR